MTIEVNATELCNRTCVFCPRHDPEVYPNQHLHMTPYMASIIAANISKSKYFGRISFSGYGENLMYKDFPKVVAEFRKELPKNIIECNTNGDILLKRDGLATELYESGLSFLYINMYDGEWQRDEFLEALDREKIPSSWYTFRKHWMEEDHGLILNNRSGVMKWIEAETDLKNPCYYPSYKMMVDWNGNVLFCSNDWGREHIVGNLLHHPIKQIWMSDKMKSFREKLGSGDRQFSPCQDCSVQGELFGKGSYEHYTKCKGK
jgi:radical SAM protein with 4Fe4S-binding SPASM domain